jgi:hypothetical protein
MHMNLGCFSLGGMDLIVPRTHVEALFIESQQYPNSKKIKVVMFGLTPTAFIVGRFFLSAVQ